MKNRKYYPFERNNYFYGKLLTVRDFEDEQKYLNDKRNLNNMMFVGAGIIRGLNTIMIDEKTISVESGMALDYMGREIIVEEAVTKKLNVIEGFENLINLDNVYLCLEYEEQNKEMVHLISGSSSDDKNNFNRVSEGYKLSLTDKIVNESLLSSDRFIEESKIIYFANGIKIKQTTPKYVRPCEIIDIKISIEKINLPRVIEVDYIFNSDYFTDEKGSKDIRIYYRDTDIKSYKTIEFIYKIKSGDTKDISTKLCIPKERGKVTIGTVVYKFENSIEYEINIIKDNINEYIIKNYMSVHFDDALNDAERNNIYIAKMRLFKKEKEYFIEAFEKNPFNQYILSNSMLYTIMKADKHKYLDYNNYTDAYSEVAITKSDYKYKRNSSFGEEIIEIDMRSKNKSYFSNEIAHGLGKGDVLINVAVEEEADSLGYDTNKNIFGDASIFQKTLYEMSLPVLSTAVMSYTEKGTFRIGVKMYENANCVAIKIKWWAYKESMDKETDVAEISDVVVFIEPNTITISPREKYKFEVTILGTSNKECKWNVLDKNGGQIDFNGVYEAPTQEGVYEVTAESVKYPDKRATAFVVVKER